VEGVLGNFSNQFESQQTRRDNWTRDDRLGQPVFLGLREDKNAIDMVREKAS
jgi:bifunctional non-homologous end joining protein LigD